MANNKIFVKRTSTSGNIPTTSQIANGELAVNMTDGILYSTNGSVVFEIGANNTNVNVSNTLTLKAISANGTVGTTGQVLTSNGTSTYWSTSAAASVNVNAQYIWTNTQSFTNTITFSNITFGNSVSNVVANSVTIVSSFGYSNPNTFIMGSYTTITGINTVLAGPYTIATGNSLIITTGSRVVII